MNMILGFGRKKKTSEKKQPEIPYQKITMNQLSDILGKTIKSDNTNKIITFLCMLSVYTKDSQFNITFRAPSSTGKSYIPMELANLFPEEDVMKIAYSSPTAFYHGTSSWNSKKKAYIANLEKKIVIFLDMPHDQLLQKLRPLLSHDQKELTYKITDHTKAYGLRTKTIILRGYPSVIFCSSNVNIDEQESTRNFILSPETTQEKIKHSIELKAGKMCNRERYNKWIENDSRRLIVKDRIRQIKEANINEVIIKNPEKITKCFIDKKMKPRDMRDVVRLISIIKSIALWSFPEKQISTGRNITATADDIEQGFKIWNEISQIQDLGIPPYIIQIFNEIIKPICNESGITRKEIISNHYKIYGKSVSMASLRCDMLPLLESAGLIFQEYDINDKRRMLVFLNSRKTTNNI